MKFLPRVLHSGLVILCLIFFDCLNASGQQTVDFNIGGHFLKGKTILKVKRDFRDPYLWILAENNEVFRMHSVSREIEDLSSQFALYSDLKFIDIAGRSRDTALIATNTNKVIHYKNGGLKLIGAAEGLVDPVNSVGINFNEGIALGEAYIGTQNSQYTYYFDTEKLVPYFESYFSQIFSATFRGLLFSGMRGGLPGSVNIATEMFSYVATYAQYIWLGGDL
jgi:hypothetical protein